MEASRKFRRDIEALPEVFAFVESFFSNEQVDPAVRYPVDLALEEIFTNFVKYNPEGETDIGVRLSVGNGQVAVALTDFDSPRFDLTTDAPDVDVNQPLEERTPGGLGIHLVKKMMDKVEYEHRNGVGTVTLYKRIG